MSLNRLFGRSWTTLAIRGPVVYRICMVPVVGAEPLGTGLPGVAGLERGSCTALLVVDDSQVVGCSFTCSIGAEAQEATVIASKTG